MKHDGGRFVSGFLILDARMWSFMHVVGWISDSMFKCYEQNNVKLKRILAAAGPSS
jgi:hypothetical protein